MDKKKPKKKENFKKRFLKGIVKGAKSVAVGARETEKFVSKYGPKAHTYFKGVSESTMGAFAVPREKPMPKLVPTAPHVKKQKMRKVKVKGRKGFFIEIA